MVKRKNVYFHFQGQGQIIQIVLGQPKIRIANKKSNVRANPILIYLEAQMQDRIADAVDQFRQVEAGRRLRNMLSQDIPQTQEIPESEMPQEEPQLRDPQLQDTPVEPFGQSMMDDFSKVEQDMEDSFNKMQGDMQGMEEQD